MNVKAKTSRWYDDDDDDDCRTGAGILKKYKLTTVAPQNKWVKLNEDIEFKQTTDEQDQGEKSERVSKKKIIFSFRSFASDGQKLIDDYIAMV